MPKISVIVPVYKVEPYLNRCVDSILNQTFTDFELILVDDGSPDKCGVICDEYAEKDKRIHVIHQKNAGLSAARNAGIDRAFANSNSEWITFIDSDDWVHKQYLDLLYNAATLNGAEVSCCGFVSVEENIEDMYMDSYKVLCGSAEELILAINNFSSFNIIISCCRLYKKHLFTDIRFPLHKYFEDSYTTYKLLYSCDKIAVVKSDLYYYYQNPNGIIGSRLTVSKLFDTFDSYLGKLDFFYTKNYIFSFQKFYSEYCAKFESYYKKYKKVPEYKHIFSLHRNNIRYFEKKYCDMLPYLRKKYGYKKWVSGRAGKIEVLKEDRKNINKSKGNFYSFIWMIKNYWSIYK